MPDHTHPGGDDALDEPLLDGRLYERRDVYDLEATAALAEHARATLQLIGEDPEREGLLKTPERVAKATQFLTHGYRLDPEAILRSAMFAESYSEMILVRDIEMFSMCEHHMLPFFGKAHVAYIPNGRIVGLSKIPRVVDVFARRLQVQERLTEQVAAALEEVLQPQGVGVVIEAAHLCMMMRGVFLEDLRTREEFLRLVAGRSSAL